MTTTAVEIITEGSPKYVFASKFKWVPIEDLQAAKEVHARTGECTCHTKERFVRDEEGYPVNMRYCEVCGKFLGFI